MNVPFPAPRIPPPRTRNPSRQGKPDTMLAAPVPAMKLHGLLSCKKAARPEPAWHKPLFAKSPQARKQPHACRPKGTPVFQHKNPDKLDDYSTNLNGTAMPSWKTRPMYIPLEHPDMSIVAVPAGTESIKAHWMLYTSTLSDPRPCGRRTVLAAWSTYTRIWSGRVAAKLLDKSSSAMKRV